MSTFVSFYYNLVSKNDISEIFYYLTKKKNFFPFASFRVNTQMLAYIKANICKR